MQLVSHILKAKGFDIWSISPDATVYTALELMSAENVGALVVIEDGMMVGIVSERDYARKVALKGKLSITARVREIMSTRVITAYPGQSIAECMKLMNERHIRHLPVVQEGELIGVLSIGDVIKALLSDKDRTIEQLENYMTGTPFSPDRRKN